MSHNLKLGEMRNEYLIDKDIWGHFNFIFSSKSKNSTTYKFVLIKSLLENLYNVNENLELTYNQVFTSFAKIYWNLVIHHSLNQINMVNRRSEVENILIDIQNTYNIPSTLVFDKLADEVQIEIIHKVTKKCKINVMGAIFGDTQHTIYDFNNREEKLKLNGSYYSFMQRFQRMLQYVANYHLALFLEKFNEQGNTMQLLLKVENISKRSSLDPFYQILQAIYEHNCFYCGKKLTKSTTHVDHFIPWSFVQADQLWNLVLSCSPCNLSKNDKLAQSIYLVDLLKRNNELLQKDTIILREDMVVYQPKKLEQLYHFSMENGYTDIWVPKKGRLIDI